MSQVLSTESFLQSVMLAMETKVKSGRCSMALATHWVILLLKFIRYWSSSVAAPALPADFPLVCSACRNLSCVCIPCWTLLRHQLSPVARLQTWTLCLPFLSVYVCPVTRYVSLELVRQVQVILLSGCMHYWVLKRHGARMTQNQSVSSWLGCSPYHFACDLLCFTKTDPSADPLQWPVVSSCTTESLSESELVSISVSGNCWTCTGEVLGSKPELSVLVGKRTADGQLRGRLLVSKWSTGPVISLRLVRRLLMMSSQLAGRWLASTGSSRLVVRLRPVSRLLRVSCRWIGQMEMLVGRSRPAISLRPVSRLLMNSGRWVGQFLLIGGRLIGLKFEEWLGVVYSTGWWRISCRSDHRLKNWFRLVESLWQEHSLQTTNISDHFWSSCSSLFIVCGEFGVFSQWFLSTALANIRAIFPFL